MVLLIPNRIREIKEEARREERERVAGLRARYERGEITLDEFFERISDAPGDRCGDCRRSG